MSIYRNGNYSAFYVKTPFNQNNLGANSTRDFVSYNLLKAWTGSDTNFPFNDSHNKNYNVRDGSDWESTLKTRLRDRISNSKNIIFFLSEHTKNSQALREELDYAINTKGLPIIVVYPDFSEKKDIANKDGLKNNVKKLWDNLPIFRDSLHKVPVIHVPNKKSLIKSALENKDFMVNTKGDPGEYFYSI